MLRATTAPTSAEPLCSSSRGGSYSPSARRCSVALGRRDGPETIDMQGRTQQRFCTKRALVVVVLALLAADCDRLRARVDLKHGNESYLSGDYRAAIDFYNQAVGRRPTLSR